MQIQNSMSQKLTLILIRFSHQKNNKWLLLIVYLMIFSHQFNDEIISSNILWYVIIEYLMCILHSHDILSHPLNWVWQVPLSFKTKWLNITSIQRAGTTHTESAKRLEKRSYGAYIKLEIVYIMIGNVKWICKISHPSQFSVVNGHSNSLESRIHLKQHFLFYPSRILA